MDEHDPVGDAGIPTLGGCLPDLSKVILERIGMDSYRVGEHKMREIIPEDEDAETGPVKTGGGGGKGEIDTERLSTMIEEFRAHWGGWGSRPERRRPGHPDSRPQWRRMPSSRTGGKTRDEKNARVQSDKATERAVLGMVRDNTQLFKLFADNPAFKRWLTNAASG